MKVYVVTRGEYSDYRMVSIYTTRHAAQSHVDLLNRADKHAHATVEEWALNESNRNALVYQVDAFPAQRHEVGSPGSEVKIERNPWPTVRDDVPVAHLSLGKYARVPEGSAYGLSYDVAEKVMRDALAMFKAEQLEQAKLSLNAAMPTAVSRRGEA